MSSFSKYVGNGAQTVFTVNQPMPSYSALEVSLDGLVETTGFTYNRTNATVTFTVAPADGVVVKLARVTQVEPIHKFATGAAFTARNVDTNFTQESYRVEELQDNVVGVKEVEESVLKASADAETALAQLLASSTDYIQVGTFSAGYDSLHNVKQTLLHSDGHRYGWAGEFPKFVPVGSTPTPLGADGWVDRSDATLRSELSQGAIKLSLFLLKTSGVTSSDVVSAAASGKDILVDVDVTVTDTTIELSQGQKWSDAGGSVRQTCVLTNPSPPNPSSPYAASHTPLFRLSNGSSLDGIVAFPAFEAVQMSGAGSVKDCIFDGEGRTWYDGILCYAWNCKIEGNEIKNFGQWLSGVTYAQRGDGIFLSNSSAYISGISVKNNKCQGNAKNGLFIIGAKSVMAHGNHFIANRMSAVQIAFLAGLGANNASGLSIIGNIGEKNGADSFDCNNNSGLSVVNANVNAIVKGNIFRSNGWIYPTRDDQLNGTGTKAETPDGGACTLANVGRVMYVNNDVYDNAATCAYLASTVECVVSGNRFYKETSRTGDDTDGFRIVGAINCYIGNNYASVPSIAYRIEGVCTGTEIGHNKTWCRNAASSGVVTPTGATGFDFHHNRVEITNGEWIVNATWAHNDCEFVASVSGSVVYTRLSSQQMSGNSYKYPAGNVSFSSCSNISLHRLKVDAATTNGNGAVYFSDLSGINRILDSNIVNSGTVPTILFAGDGSTSAFTTTIRGTTVKNTAAANSIRVNGGVSTMVFKTDDIDVSVGYAEFGASSRRQLTWA